MVQKPARPVGREGRERGGGGAISEGVTVKSRKQDENKSIVT